jgi:hypothetical protein
MKAKNYTKKGEVTMIKTIKTYDVETARGVARFVNGYQEIVRMSRDHRISAKDAIVDMKAAIRKAGLTIGEQFVIAKVSQTGEYVHGEEKHLFFSACEKIAKVFHDEQYGEIEILRYTH